MQTHIQNYALPTPNLLCQTKFRQKITLYLTWVSRKLTNLPHTLPCVIYRIHYTWISHTPNTRVEAGYLSCSL